MNNTLEFITKKTKYVQDKTTKVYLNGKEKKCNAEEFFNFAKKYASKNYIGFSKKHDNKLENISFNNGEEIFNAYTIDLKKKKMRYKKLKETVATISAIGLSAFISGSIFGLGKKYTDDYNHLNASYETTTSNNTALAGITQELANNCNLNNYNFTIEEQEIMEVAASNINNEQLEELKNTENIMETIQEANLYQEEEIIVDKEFHFNYEDRSETYKENTLGYQDYFTKYGDMYGIPSEVLDGRARQETNGLHDRFKSGYPGVGLMQIDRSLGGKTITAYNFETNTWDTETVDIASLENSVEYNIKLGAMFTQIWINEYNGDVLKGIQAYNYGYLIESKLNGYGEDWINHRTDINGGDKSRGDDEYIEHIFSFIENETILTFKRVDKEDYTIQVINDRVLTNNNDEVKVYEKAM